MKRAVRGRVSPPPLKRRPPGGPFGASKAVAWHAQQVVQSAVTPMQVRRHFGRRGREGVTKYPRCCEKQFGARKGWVPWSIPVSCRRKVLAAVDVASTCGRMCPCRNETVGYVSRGGQVLTRDPFATRVFRWSSIGRVGTQVVDKKAVAERLERKRAVGVLTDKVLRLLLWCLEVGALFMPFSGCVSSIVGRDPPPSAPSFHAAVCHRACSMVVYASHQDHALSE